ncbi:uncharacterized protein LOC134181480 isoform X2 [Corticium candelabrum]|uniref:uncharacterized protein LOC134181480 isoform X2 n=1 Tax=Corticium candelabrum TaxID=121492 RepID=UPI002E271345|nr:uncharacterized protein LOC134181480 isoform X2 [Corticium candelabrum]
MSPLSRCTPLARFFVALNFVVAFQVVAAALTDSKAKFEKTSRTYVLVDGQYLREAVQTVVELARRRDVETRSDLANNMESMNVDIIDVQDSGETCTCCLVYVSVVVHLTTACLPDHSPQLRTPVVSIPSRAGHPMAATHVSFTGGRRSEIAVFLAVASSMKWKSVVYVGDTSPDTTFLEQLQVVKTTTLVFRDVVSIKDGVATDPYILYERVAYADADVLLLHCHTRSCYESLKKVFQIRNERGSEQFIPPWFITESLTQNVKVGALGGPLIMQSTTHGLRRSLFSNPQSDQLLTAVPSLVLSHQCYTRNDCPTTKQVEVLDFYDSVVAASYLAKNESPCNGSRSLASVLDEASLQGIHGPLRFDVSVHERIHPSLYHVLDISPSLATTIGVYDVNSTHWLHEPKPLDESPGYLKSRGRHRREARASKCYKAATETQNSIPILRATTIIGRTSVRYLRSEF